ncbi:hypothetical protein HMN09_00807400 [Mycena chlorophos]|uniref:Uncharacterized protein n=1 Tax=Mycena chlorophos TaxID=658473 RepID=A0A8H6SX60_MYCCL|nr:hypothetical protein HMN09_00807400 [Mycena chlorophos]
MTEITCLNLNRCSVSAKTFYRWFHLCNDSLNSPVAALDPTIVLRPITIELWDVMVYGVASVDGPAIPRDSLQVIEPGTYGVFRSDGTPYTGNVNCIGGYGFNFEKDVAVCRCYSGPELVTQQNEISSELSRRATARDKGRCIITGRADEETELVWIVPPAVAFNSDPENPQTTLNMHRHVDNIVTISSSLVHSFNRNAFTIDIEDGACVVRFEDLPTGAPALPSHLPALLQSPSAPFWRSHFKHTLTVFLPAGRANYEPDEANPAQAWMEELSEDLADLDDAKWKTPLGKEVFQVFLARALLDPVEESDDDDTDDW